jgi:G3E family GTPase
MVLQTQHSAVDLKCILNTGLFSMSRAEQMPGWLKALNGEKLPETEEYGITSFVYRKHWPFHPKRFHDFLHQEWPGLLRAKGFFWLATRMEESGMLSIAGGACNIDPAGKWWVATPLDDWPDDAEEVKAIREQWTKDWGDRRQELVFIGIKLDQERLCRSLDKCLLTNVEMARGEAHWRKLKDPFGDWSMMTDHALKPQQP